MSSSRHDEGEGQRLCFACGNVQACNDLIGFHVANKDLTLAREQIGCQSVSMFACTKVKTLIQGSNTCDLTYMVATLGYRGNSTALAQSICPVGKT